MTAWLPPAEMQRRFDTTQRLLAANRLLEARTTLQPVVEAAPKDAAVRQLMAQVLSRANDLPGAERELRAAIAAAPKAAPLHMQLGVVLAHQGREAEAEAALRSALAADRRFAPAGQALAELLDHSGRSVEAVKVLEPFRSVDDANLADAYGMALKHAGRKRESVEQHRRAVAMAPEVAIFHHNLASAHGDLSEFAQAEAATARALSMGLDAPETWLVRGRALAGLDRLDEAQDALEQAIRRRPTFADAHRDWAQLAWARTGDLAHAVSRLDAALAAHPAEQPLMVDRARLLQYAGDAEGADRALAAVADLPGAQPRLKGTASQMAVRRDPDRAARYAEAAVAAAPGDDDLLRTLCEARLAQGDWAAAETIAYDLVRRAPDDQGSLALLHTAWRLAGDPRRSARDDFPALVKARPIDAPPGWDTLPAYLADLTAALTRLHVTKAHPVGQSLRGGTQTGQNLLQSEDPAVKAFPQAIDGSIRAYLADLGRGPDPIRARNTGKYRIAGIWSVRLAAQGRHVDHLHPAGWISSACYVALPPAVGAGGREGWIKFGEPGVPTMPKLEPEHWVKPEPGTLVLFPSYMWHGTAPFSGDEPRLTVAFDLLPG